MRKDLLTMLSFFSFLSLVTCIGKPVNFNRRLKFLLILVLSFFCFISMGQTLVHSIPTSNTSFPLPAGMDQVTVEAWGAGGAGGAANLTPLTGRSGGGGGGGAYARGTITTTGYSSLNVVVGATVSGGTGNGASGGDSYITGFTSTFNAPGGKGGNANIATNSSPTGGAGGTGAIGNLATANGVDGGTGASAALGLLLTSGAGGNAGNFGAGLGGAGGAARSTVVLATNPGNPGDIYGGGGGGAISASTLQNGGNGARGHVNITYTCKTYSLTGISAANVCTATGSTSLVQLTGISTSLPAGTYTVTYNTSSPAATGLTATMGVAGGIGNFTAVGFNVLGTSKITVTSLTSVDCTSTISLNNSVDIVVGAQPTLALGATAAVCTSSSAQSTTLPYSATTNSPSTYSITWNASPANSFLPVTNSALTASPINISIPANTPAGIYTGNLTVGNIAGCTSTVYNFTVTVNPLPTITLGATTAVCTSSSAQSTTLPYTAVSNSPTTYSIVWNASPVNSFVPVTNAALPASPITIPIPANTAAGTYTGTLTVSNANGCTSTANNFTVTVNPLPTITLGSTAAVCTSSSAQSTTLPYTAVSNSPTTYSIVWNASPVNSFVPVTNAALPASPITIPIPANTAAGVYTGTLTVSNANGCTSTANNFTVTVNPLPTITLGSSVAVCASANTQSTTLPYTATTNSPTTYSITWSAIPTNNFISVTDAALTSSPINIAIPAGTSAGTYTGTLTVKNANGCVSTGTNFTITINSVPTITTSGNLTPVCQNVSVQTASLPYSTVTGSPTSYSIDWALLSDQGVTAFSFNSGGGNINNITIPANAAVGTYSGVMTIFAANGCQTTQLISLTINSVPTISTAGVFAPVCQSSSAQTTTLSYNSTTGSPTSYAIDWIALTDQASTPFPFSSGSGNIINVNVPANASSGTYNGIMTITTSSGCSVNQNVSLTVNPVSAAPTASVTQQPSCINNTGVITVTSPAPGSGYTYSIDGVDFSNTSGIFAGLSSGIYNVQVKNIATGCESASTSLPINASITKVWNGNVDANWGNAANWTPAGVPIASDCIDIPDVGFDPIISGTDANVFASRLTIQNNGSLIVKETNTITVTNEVSVLGTGTLIFENNSSLVQIADVPNTGNIIYKRNTTPVRRYDVTYWSSPVTRDPAFTLHDFSPNTLWDKFHKWNSATQTWILISNGAEEMVAGNGYSIRSPQFYDINSTAIFTGEFVGVPNNGTISGPPSVAEKLVFLGNPYPSALYADQFIHDNADRLYGTLLFWTHNSSPTQIPGTNSYGYSSNDFAYYNLSGEITVGQMVGTPAPTPGNQSVPAGYIAAGQGFFAKSITGQSVVFTNSMRVPNRNSQFYKSSGDADIERHRVWLNFTNTEGAFKQLLIGYVTGATNSWDNSYDAITLNANPYVDFYSINEGKKLVIQGRAIPFVVTDTIPLGYKSTIPTGKFTIAIDHADGDLTNQDIYLQDNATKTIHNLKTGGYTFTSAPGTFLNRFVLRYKNPQDVLGNQDFENQDQKIFVSVKDKSIKLESISEQENLEEVAIYDSGGSLLYRKKQIANKEWVIPNFQSGPQVLLVKITLENGKTLTRKIVFR